VKVLAAAAAIAALAACSSAARPGPAAGPPTLRFEVLSAGVQSITAVITGPTVTSPFGRTSLTSGRSPSDAVALPYVSPPVQVSAQARYELHVVTRTVAPSVLDAPALVTCRVLYRGQVIYERTAPGCDVTGRLGEPGR
jgi:hypothetical protein